MKRQKDSPVERQRDSPGEAREGLTCGALEDPPGGAPKDPDDGLVADGADQQGEEQQRHHLPTTKPVSCAHYSGHIAFVNYFLRC